jgi:UDP-N-acetylglucosamine--N-acetylmuramyl-(pentapeptide) pyrophosphoryl-undecaprenol N-acetylglucosamine transferase
LAVLEPNSVLGLANRWLVPFARRAYVAFPDAEKKLGRALAQRTGVPLRGTFRATPYVPDAERFRVLVLGGSQGAKGLNEVVPAALSLALRDAGALTVVHQAGRDRDEAVRGAYRALGVDDRASVVPFLDDVAGELERADLVIERAGASSLAELCAVGRPSILVPFPFAADDHQRKNAEALMSGGAAIFIDHGDASAERVAAEVIALVRDPARRVAMADAARALGRPDAARDVARDLLALAGIPVHSRSSNPSTTGTGSTPTGTATGTATATATTTREETAHV